MESIFFVYIAAIIAFMLIDMKIGVSLYLVYTILVPYDLIVFSINASSLLHVFLILSLIIHSHKYFKKGGVLDNLRPFFPILLLFVVLFCFTPFQRYVPFGQELTYFQYEMRQFFLLPFVIWCVTKHDPKAVKTITISMIIASFMVFAYEFFLLANDGVNYYILMLSEMAGKEAHHYFEGYDDSRFIVRACSTFAHSMNYALFLILDYVFILSLKDKINKGIWFALLACCIVCIFTSNVRSAIVAFVVASAFYVLLMKNFKVALAFLLGGLILFSIIDRIPGFREFIESLYKKGTELEGSSFDLRMLQLEGSLEEISDCPIFGKGYDWSSYYIMLYQRHPKIQCFESSIFKYLCNWGFVGLFLYFTAYYRFVSYSYKIMRARPEKIQALSLIVVFLTYCIATGDYNYTQYFMPIYALFLANYHKTQYLSCKIQKS